MNKLTKAFASGKALIPFLTCGDPDTETTLQTVREMVQNGADIIELGIPFSDPTAEGPIIQGANARALQGGITTDRMFDLVRRIRQETEIPLVFMTYANVVFSYGIERFLKQCKAVQIDGLILPDVPLEEKEEFVPLCRQYGVAWIAMVAPTSKERIPAIVKEAEGFVYVVSSLGVTGVRSKIETDVQALVQEVKAYTDTPCAIGFGIQTPEQAGQMARIADGVIVGSAIVKQLEQYGTNAPAQIGDYVRELKEAVQEVDG